MAKREKTLVALARSAQSPRKAKAKARPVRKARVRPVRKAKLKLRPAERERAKRKGVLEETYVPKSFDSLVDEQRCEEYLWETLE